MIKILTFSDVHTEFHADTGKSFFESFKNVDYDVAVIAGDISNNRLLPQSLEYIADNFKDVVFVKGNHDVWGSSIGKTDELIRGICENKSNLHYLEKSSITIGEQRFSGCCMWFKFTPMNPVLGRGWSDFLNIKYFDREVYTQNEASLSFLKKEVQKDDVVITHHLPSEKCVSDRFKNDPYNVFFVYPIDEIIMEKQYKLHIYGHSHSSMDVNLGLTRVINNPFGYAGHQLNPDYIENFVIEV